MALSNYTELQSHIADTLNRDDLSTVIPEFIVMAESRLNREIRHWRMEKRATASFDAQYTALPTDFLQPIRFVVETTPICTLEQQNAKGIADLREVNNATGKPTSYCILDGSIEVHPTPDTAYTVEMTYYEKIDSLNSGNPTNWLLENYPDAYLYGSLLHSAPYLAESERLAEYGALYQSSIDGINTDSDQSRTASSGRRIIIRRY